jgi:hypothetical protein
MVSPVGEGGGRSLALHPCDIAAGIKDSVADFSGAYILKNNPPPWGGEYPPMSFGGKNMKREKGGKCKKRERGKKMRKEKVKG